MRRAQLEALVVQAVDASRAGHREDDQFEFKRTWPDPAVKARQLAGAANRARGEALVWVIGIDDDGTVHPPGDTDPSDWMAQLLSRFDGPAPELIQHLAVALPDGGHVVALDFATDEAPYVVKRTDGQLEVPIRTATGTRSATRTQLLRMLAPTIHMPRIEILEAKLTLHVFSESATVRLRAQVYFEHLRREPAFLPSHRAVAELIGPPDVRSTDSLIYSTGHALMGSIRAQASPPPGGPVARKDGLELSGPGRVNVHAHWTFPASEYEAIASWGSPLVRLRLGIAGSGEVVISSRFDHRQHIPPQGSHPARVEWLLADENDLRIKALRLADQAATTDPEATAT